MNMAVGSVKIVVTKSYERTKSVSRKPLRTTNYES